MALLLKLVLAHVVLRHDVKFENGGRDCWFYRRTLMSKCCSGKDDKRKGFCDVAIILYADIYYLIILSPWT